MITNVVQDRRIREDATVGRLAAEPDANRVEQLERRAAARGAHAALHSDNARRIRSTERARARFSRVRDFRLDARATSSRIPSRMP